VKQVSATRANREFSKLLGEVEKGETVQVTSHGRPVARIIPEPESDEAAREAAFRQWLEEMRARPALNLGPWTRDELYEDDA
jgi:prevent-host-death family protein